MVNGNKQNIFNEGRINDKAPMVISTIQISVVSGTESKSSFTEINRYNYLYFSGINTVKKKAYPI